LPGHPKANLASVKEGTLSTWEKMQQKQWQQHQQWDPPQFWSQQLQQQVEQQIASANSPLGKIDKAMSLGIVLVFRNCL